MKNILLLSIIFAWGCVGWPQTARDLAVIAGPELVAQYVDDNTEAAEAFLAVADQLEGKPTSLSSEDQTYVKLAQYVVARLAEKYGTESDAGLFAAILRAGVNQSKASSK